jgi:hypothetical protein
MYARASRQASDWKPEMRAARARSLDSTRYYFGSGNSQHLPAHTKTFLKSTSAKMVGLRRSKNNHTKIVDF